MKISDEKAKYLAQAAKDFDDAKEADRICAKVQKIIDKYGARGYIINVAQGRVGCYKQLFWEAGK